jgi:hypothetical protein
MGTGSHGAGLAAAGRGQGSIPSGAETPYSIPVKVFSDFHGNGREYNVPTPLQKPEQTLLNSILYLCFQCFTWVYGGEIVTRTRGLLRDWQAF